MAIPHDYCSIHWVFTITVRSVAFPGAEKKQIKLKRIKVFWPNLSCWGSHSILCIQVTHRALLLSTPPSTTPSSTSHPPPQHIQPEPSIACLTWHIITVEIFVYFVRVPQPVLQPTAKSSLLPLQLSQPESLIKTRCFHLGQLWKKSLPEMGLSLPSPYCCKVCHVWQGWHAHCTKRAFLFFFSFLV